MEVILAIGRIIGKNEPDYVSLGITLPGERVQIKMSLEEFAELLLGTTIFTAKALVKKDGDESEV